MLFLCYFTASRICCFATFAGFFPIFGVLLLWCFTLSLFRCFAVSLFHSLLEDVFGWNIGHVNTYKVALGRSTVHVIT